MHNSSQDTLKALGISAECSGTFNGGWLTGGSAQEIRSPIDSTILASVRFSDPAHIEDVIRNASETFLRFRECPAPKRGEIIRDFATEVRNKKQALAELIVWEMGKILPEALGEVQEVIDIADFAVGLSRQLYGLSMHSERPFHRMYEQWHPLGPVAVISAFNFPMAVWAWNSCIAAVCGDTVIWKPSELTTLSAIGLTDIAGKVAAAHGFPGLFTLLSGTGASTGAALVDDPRIPLVSATGSTAMGRTVGTRVAKRLGRSLLELGGNNSVVVLADADLDLSARAIVFGAVGTAGQRCTTIRRLLVEGAVLEPLVKRLTGAYAQIRIGNPLDSNTLMGPLVHQRAVEQFEKALVRAKEEGGKIIFGGKVRNDFSSPNYVEPTMVLVEKTIPLMNEETFAPILFIQSISGIEDGIAKNNDVSQGLSSAVFTRSVKASERFLSVAGSDCGIANVNIGTSGAEIGGAFGGEKDTGGGREAGSDSWKAYMRRQTTTINWGDTLPLAQGVRFE